MGGPRTSRHTGWNDAPAPSDGKSPECEKGHGLKPFKTVKSDWGCSMCTTKIPKGTEIHRCGPCDYDLCHRCFKAATSNASSINSGSSIGDSYYGHSYGMHRSRGHPDTPDYKTQVQRLDKLASKFTAQITLLEEDYGVDVDDIKKEI